MARDRNLDSKCAQQPERLPGQQTEIRYLMLNHPSAAPTLCRPAINWVCEFMKIMLRYFEQLLCHKCIYCVVCLIDM